MMLSVPEARLAEPFVLMQWGLSIINNASTGAHAGSAFCVCMCDRLSKPF